MEYPKPRWDLENDVLRLEQMIHLYQDEIQKLEVENKELQQQVATLTRKIKYYKIYEVRFVIIRVRTVESIF